ncbi:MAG: response regulator [Anaerolineae bacterium]|nr:response regulator [Anaerolineae bacterium]
MSEKARIIVVDDEVGMCEFLRYLLEGEGYQVDYAHSGIDALEKLKAKLDSEPFHLVLADIRMPGMDGLELLRKVKEIDPGIVFVVMTGFASLETAIKVIKYDGYDYLVKPFDDTDKILAVIEKGLADQKETIGS